MELHSCCVAVLFVAILPITVTASDVEALYCGQSFDVAAARNRWSVARRKAWTLLILASGPGTAARPHATRRAGVHEARRPLFASRRATYCSLKTRSPATIGRCSAINLGGASTPSLTKLPPFHFGLTCAQPLPAERRAQQKQPLRQEKTHDPMCTNMDGR